MKSDIKKQLLKRNTIATTTFPEDRPKLLKIIGRSVTWRKRLTKKDTREEIEGFH